jgi:manganese transport protein
MPHNLYLHSSAVSTRKILPGNAAKSDAIKLMTFDTIMSLTLAFFVNAAILILAATAFHFSGHRDVKEIDDAYYLLTPILGTSIASTIFAFALFASGQSSTLTGTIASQVFSRGS